MKHTPFTLARETAENPPKERVFLAAYRFLFFYGLAVSAVALPILFLLTHTHPTFAHFLQDLVRIAWFLIPALAAISFPLTWFYRVRVKSEGIHGGTIWSTPVYMTFAEMESVEPRSVMGFPYLRVKSFRESCPPLWIPRCLADPASFRDTVINSTAPSNPFRKSLENGNTPENRTAVPQK